MIKISLLIVIFTLALSSCTENKIHTNKIEQTKQLIKQSTNTSKHQFLWREKKYSIEVNDTIYETTISDAYAKNMAEDEKAAIAFVLTFINNGCDREDGEMNQNRNNLLCKGLSALGLSYQCSNKHISFLNKWFEGDTSTLKRIKYCPHNFPGVTISSHLKSLDLERKHDTITIFTSVIGSNTRAQKTSEWKNSYTFISNKKTITLTKEKLRQR
jgi:hypothetical protein